MLKQRRGQRRKQIGDSGMATLESLPLLIVFIVIAGYMFGMFGVTHTAILNSIGARTYAFEIFRHRADLTYLRSDATATSFDRYHKAGARIMTVTSDASRDGVAGNQFPATERRIAMGLDTPLAKRDDVNTHNTAVFTINERRNETVEVNPVWIMTQYGICMNARCVPQ